MFNHTGFILGYPWMKVFGECRLHGHKHPAGALCQGQSMCQQDWHAQGVVVLQREYSNPSL